MCTLSEPADRLDRCIFGFPDYYRVGSYEPCGIVCGVSFALCLFSKIGRARSHQPSHLLCLTTQDTGETPDNQHPGHRPAPTRWAGCLPFHQHVFHPLHLLDRPTSEAKHPSEHVKCSGVPDQNTMCQRKKTTRFRTNPTMIKLLLVVFKLPE